MRLEVFNIRIFVDISKYKALLVCLVIFGVGVVIGGLLL